MIFQTDEFGFIPVENETAVNLSYLNAQNHSDFTGVKYSKI